MLKQKELTTMLKHTIKDCAYVAMKSAMLGESKRNSKANKEKIDKFAKTFSSILAKNLSEGMAIAIDTYIRSIEFTGLIITTGTPVTQQATIVPMEIGNFMAGIVPNTIGLMEGPPE